MRRLKRSEAFGAEIACRTGVAPIAPTVAVHAVALITRMRAFRDEVDQRRTTERFGEGPKKGNQRLSDALALAFLKGENESRYAAQLNLAPSHTPAFLQRIPGAGIGTNLPDLICRTSDGAKTKFSIIDIKATRRATAFHKAQVAFYVRLLEARLKELKQTASVSRTGEIWRFPDKGPLDGGTWIEEKFDLAPYLRQVDRFCEQILPDILASEVSPGVDHTFFHVYFKCEQCKFLPHCIGSVRPEASARVLDVSAVAGMSHQSKRTLADRKITTVPDLANATSEVAARAESGWRLSKSIGTLIERAKAIRDDKIYPGTDRQTYLMPPRTDVALYLTADFDAVDGNIAALGYLHVSANVARNFVRVIPGSDSGAEAEALVAIFERVVRDLTAVDAHNRNVERSGAGQALQAHIFVYEPNDAVHLQDAIKRHLSDARVRTGLLNMVRLFPPEEIIPEPEFRGIDHLPATALRTVVEQVFALPVTVSHDLAQVSAALERHGAIKNAYRPAKEFARPFSSMLAIDVIRNLREGRAGAVSIEAIEQDVIDRLNVSRSVAEWLFAEHEKSIAGGGLPILRLRKKPFALQATFNPLDAGDLDILGALELLENRSTKLETLVRLSRAKDARRETGKAIGPLTLIREEDNGRTWVLQAQADLVEADLSADSFGLILTDGEPENVLEPSLWDAFSCEIRRVYPRQIFLRVPPRNQWTPARIALERRMSMAGNGEWWIDQAFKDVNTGRIRDFVEYLGRGAQ